MPCKGDIFLAPAFKPGISKNNVFIDAQIIKGEAINMTASKVEHPRRCRDLRRNIGVSSDDAGSCAEKTSCQFQPRLKSRDYKYSTRLELFDYMTAIYNLTAMPPFAGTRL